jgi:hypothetical protein
VSVKNVKIFCFGTLTVCLFQSSDFCMFVGRFPREICAYFAILYFFGTFFDVLNRLEQQI